MTIQYRPSSLPQEEAAQSPMPCEQESIPKSPPSYGQVLPTSFNGDRTHLRQTGPDTLSAASGSDHSRPRETNPDIEPNTESILNLSAPHPSSGDDYLHHILIGSPKAVQDTIKLLHVLRYVEGRLWTPLIAIREQGLRITPNEGEVLSYLVRQHLKRQ